MADRLSPLSDLRCGEPSFGQPAHAQQIGQIRRVSLVVLDAAIGEPLHPQGMGEVDSGPAVGEDVGGPVSAVGGLEDDLGVRTGLGSLGG